MSILGSGPLGEAGRHDWHVGDSAFKTIMLCRIILFLWKCVLMCQNFQAFILFSFIAGKHVDLKWTWWWKLQMTGVEAKSVSANDQKQKKKKARNWKELAEPSAQADDSTMRQVLYHASLVSTWYTLIESHCLYILIITIKDDCTKRYFLWGKSFLCTRSIHLMDPVPGKTNAL